MNGSILPGGANLGNYKIETTGAGCRIANRTMKSATSARLSHSDGQQKYHSSTEAGFINRK
jgi:hypothetical protein